MKNYGHLPEIEDSDGDKKDDSKIIKVKDYDGSPELREKLTKLGD